VIFFARSIRQNYTGVTESNQSKRFAKMTNVCGCNWAFFGYRQTATRNNVANPAWQPVTRSVVQSWYCKR